MKYGNKGRDYIEQLDDIEKLCDLAKFFWDILSSTDQHEVVRDWSYYDLADGESTPQSKFCDSVYHDKEQPNEKP